MINLDFPYEKITQALNYLAIKSGGKINKMKVIKLIYFADRFHLRKYGELFTNDMYFAMKKGPVPSITKDIATQNIFLEDNVLAYTSTYLDAAEQYELKSKEKCDYDFLSESDIEALNFAFDNFGDKDHFQLAEISHSYPEWLDVKDKLTTNKRVAINILDFIKDPINGLNPCFDLSDEDKEDLLEELNDKKVINLICN